MSYNSETDALDLRFADDPVATSEQVRPGVTIDLDAQGKILGIAVVKASERLNGHATIAASSKVDRDTPASRQRKRIDVDALRALAATMPMQTESASSFIRAMRDSERY